MTFVFFISLLNIKKKIVMKRFLIFAAACAVCAFAVNACGNNSADRLTERFEQFIDDTQKEMEEFTEEDWAQVEKEFNEFVEKFSEEADKFTDEQREKIDKAIGKFSGIKAKHDLSRVFDDAKDLIESIPAKSEGFIDGLTGGEDVPADQDSVVAE